MYEKILVALDGSPLSESVLPYARSFADALKIPVELLQVIDPEVVVPSTVTERDRYHDILTPMRELASNYLKKIASSFSGSVPVDFSVEIGSPADLILDKAEACAGTLVAMATHGRSGLKRWLLGSIAEKVVRAARNPLLLVRASDERKAGEAASLKRIMVPLDGSTLAELVLPEAEELARKMDLEMVLVRAYAVPTPLYTAETYTYNIQELWDQISKEAEDYLAEKVRQLQAQGVKTVSAMPVAGVAAEKIIDLAREKTASLVAMCTHGRTGVGRWVMGSVTERVVRHSDNPVLVIRAASGSPNPSS